MAVVSVGWNAYVEPASPTGSTRSAATTTSRCGSRWTASDARRDRATRRRRSSARATRPPSGTSSGGSSCSRASPPSRTPTRLPTKGAEFIVEMDGSVPLAPRAGGGPLWVRSAFVGADFFEHFDAPIVSGRGFTAAEADLGASSRGRGRNLRADHPRRARSGWPARARTGARHAPGRGTRSSASSGTSRRNPSRRRRTRCCTARPRRAPPAGRRRWWYGPAGTRPRSRRRSAGWPRKPIPTLRLVRRHAARRDPQGRRHGVRVLPARARDRVARWRCSSRRPASTR